MTVLRSVAAVAAGFLLFLGAERIIPAPAGVYAMNFLLLSVTWTVLAAVVAGFVTATIAGYREVPHAAMLGFLMVATGFISMKQQGIAQPGWYQTTIAGCGPVSALIGAALRLLMKVRARR